ncbi:MAG: DNA-3-methyladenine glycosylase [Steroidobacteraceae bacterium]
MRHSSTSRGTRPPRSYFARPSLELAPDLLGLHVLHDDGGTLRIGRIVETEAYMGPEDLAAHSAGGRRTARTEVMFGPPGHASISFIYGFWNCLNVVASPPGVPHAVLLRALEPVAHLDGAAWGPGLLCRAMHVDRSLNGADLRGGGLWIERPAGKRREVRIGTSPRIGVAYAGEWARRPWRFFDRDSPHVSKLSAAVRRRAGVR